METQEAVNTAIQTPPPGEVAPPSTEVPVSVAEHAAQFDPKREPTADPVEPQAPVTPERRHRARSQQAGPEDVPRIAELTKRLRAAEAERDEWKGKASQPAPVVPVPRDTESGKFIEPKSPAATPTGKPSWETFEAQIGSTYGTWHQAQDAWADARDGWKDTEAQRVASERQTTEQQQAAQQAFAKEVSTHLERMQAYAAEKPDFQTATAQLQDTHLPGPLLAAITRSDNGPAFVYHLATHPDDFDEVYLASAGKPLDDALVATLQRRLLKLSSSTAPIASVAGPQHVPPPRPPNAMRTSAMQTGDDLPGDGHSLAEHAKHFGAKRR